MSSRSSSQAWAPPWPPARTGDVLRLVTVVGVLLAAARFGPHASRMGVVAIYGAMAAVALYRASDIGLPALMITAALVPFEVGTGTGSSVNIAMIGVAGLTGLWVLRMVADRRLRLAPSPANWAWLALIVTTGISIVAGGALWNPWVTTKENFLLVQLAQWSIFILSACAWWLAANQPSGRRILVWMTAILIGAGVVLLVSAVVPHLAFVQRHLLSQSVVFRTWVVSLALSLALYHTGLRRPWRAALATLAAGVVLSSYVHGYGWQSGWLPPLVALGAVVAVWVGRGLTRVAAWAAVPGLVVMATVVLPAVARTERWSFDTRLLAWRGLAQMMEGRWLFGLGLAAYWHYWRDVIGYFAYLDPTTGYLHYTYDPQVNMHNNFVDVYGQAGVLGLLALLALLAALYMEIRQQFLLETTPFGRAFLAAAAAALTGMIFAAMLGDWILPFVYNIGLKGFRDSFLGWLMLGGVVLLKRTRAPQPTRDPAPPQPST